MLKRLRGDAGLHDAVGLLEAADGGFRRRVKDAGNAAGEVAQILQALLQRLHGQPGVAQLEGFVFGGVVVAAGVAAVEQGGVVDGDVAVRVDDHLRLLFLSGFVRLGRCEGGR